MAVPSCSRWQERAVLLLMGCASAILFDALLPNLLFREANPAVSRSRPIHLGVHSGSSNRLEDRLHHSLDPSCRLLTPSTADLQPLHVNLISAWKPTPDFTLLTAWLKPEYPSAVPPPKDIPATYMDSFTMQGRVEIRSWYVDGTDYLGGKQTGRGWTKEGVEKLQQTTRTEGGNYGKESLNLYTALARYQPFFEDKRGVIIGSETPWAEAIALNHNVASIMTVEYGALTCDHPKIETKLVSEFTQGVLNGDIAPFDWAISYSSLEHDGMGRYGDVLNPDGDLHSMAKALTYVKPGGMFLLAVPQADADAVEWNAHRVYGPLRLPLLTAGWRLVDVVYSTVGVYQHLLVLQNTFGCSA